MTPKLELALSMFISANMLSQQRESRDVGGGGDSDSRDVGGGGDSDSDAQTSAKPYQVLERTAPRNPKNLLLQRPKRLNGVLFGNANELNPTNFKHLMVVVNDLNESRIFGNRTQAFVELSGSWRRNTTKEQITTLISRAVQVSMKQWHQDIVVPKFNDHMFDLYLCDNKTGLVERITLKNQPIPGEKYKCSWSHSICEGMEVDATSVLGPTFPAAVGTFCVSAFPDSELDLPIPEDTVYEYPPSPTGLVMKQRSLIEAVYYAATGADPTVNSKFTVNLYNRIINFIATAISSDDHCVACSSEACTRDGRYLGYRLPRGIKMDRDSPNFYCWHIGQVCGSNEAIEYPPFAIPQVLHQERAKTASLQKALSELEQECESNESKMNALYMSSRKEKKQMRETLAKMEQTLQAEKDRNQHLQQRMEEWLENRNGQEDLHPQGDGGGGSDVPLLEATQGEQISHQTTVDENGRGPFSYPPNDNAEDFGGLQDDDDPPNDNAEDFGEFPDDDDSSAGASGGHGRPTENHDDIGTSSGNDGDGTSSGNLAFEGLDEVSDPNKNKCPFCEAVLNVQSDQEYVMTGPLRTDSMKDTNTLGTTAFTNAHSAEEMRKSMYNHQNTGCPGPLHWALLHCKKMGERLGVVHYLVRGLSYGGAPDFVQPKDIQNRDSLKTKIENIFNKVIGLCETTFKVENNLVHSLVRLKGDSDQIVWEDVLRAHSAFATRKQSNRPRVPAEVYTMLRDVLLPMFHCLKMMYLRAIQDLDLDQDHLWNTINLSMVSPLHFYYKNPFLSYKEMYAFWPERMPEVDYLDKYLNKIPKELGKREAGIGKKIRLTVQHLFPDHHQEGQVRRTEFLLPPLFEGGSLTCTVPSAAVQYPHFGRDVLCGCKRNPLFSAFEVSKVNGEYVVGKRICTNCKTLKCTDCLKELQDLCKSCLGEEAHSEDNDHRKSKELRRARSRDRSSSRDRCSRKEHKHRKSRRKGTGGSLDRKHKKKSRQRSYSSETSSSTSSGSRSYDKKGLAGSLDRKHKKKASSSGSRSSERKGRAGSLDRKHKKKSRQRSYSSETSSFSGSLSSDRKPRAEDRQNRKKPRQRSYSSERSGEDRQKRKKPRQRSYSSERSGEDRQNRKEPRERSYSSDRSR